MIEIKNLTKKFDDFTAVDDLSLTIKTGEFFGLLEPMEPERLPPSVCCLHCYFLHRERSLLMESGLPERDRH